MNKLIEFFSIFCFCSFFLIGQSQSDPFFYTDSISAPSQSQVCIDVKTQHFVEIITIQFSLGWNPALVAFNQIENLNADIGLDMNAIGLVGVENGYLRFNYFTVDPEGASLEDDAILFTLCFDVIGESGTESPFGISEFPLNIEIFTLNGMANANWENGNIQITDPDTFSIFTNGCLDQEFDDLGTLQFIADGGLSPYSISYMNIDDPNINGEITIMNDGDSENINDLPIGLYNFVAEDDTGLQIIDSVIVTDSIPVFGTLDATDMSCSYLEDGQIQLNPSPILEEYFIGWSNGIVNTNELTGLNSGTYFLTVTNRLQPHCSVFDSAFIDIPAAISIVDSISYATCDPGNDGQIMISNISGGTSNGVYNILWNTGSTETSIENLTSDIYYVTITDDEFCALTRQYDLNDMPPIIDLSGSSELACPGDSTGMISMQIMGVNAEIAGFTWSTGDSSLTIENLLAGTYSVTVSNELNCTTVAEHTIGEPEPLSVTLNHNGATNCIEAIASGGTPPYQYAIDCINFDNTGQFCNLGLGTYTLCILDSNGCMMEEMFNITSTQNFSQESLVQFNNPVVDHLMIKHSRGLGQLVSVQILDINGYPVVNRNFTITNAPEINIDLSDLNPGPYLLRVQIGQYRSNHILIKSQ